ncbi:MAG: multicopper oxidase domain-containing protein [Pseudorhodoplanes sp.]|nr:multicopper oxidase domain-containing protein [Pseudorhodoplanes sp.]
MAFADALRVEIPLEGAATDAMAMRRGPDAGPPLFRVRRGRTVVIAMSNRTVFLHAMHLHGHHFRLLDNLDDGWKPFWLDTVLIAPERTTRIAFVADNPGKWMIDYRRLGYQETGMAAWFEVG